MVLRKKRGGGGTTSLSKRDNTLAMESELASALTQWKLSDAPVPLLVARVLAAKKAVAAEGIGESGRTSSSDIWAALVLRAECQASRHIRIRSENDEDPGAELKRRKLDGASDEVASSATHNKRGAESPCQLDREIVHDDRTTKKLKTLKKSERPVAWRIEFPSQSRMNDSADEVMKLSESIESDQMSTAIHANENTFANQGEPEVPALLCCFRHACSRSDSCRVKRLTHFLEAVTCQFDSRAPR